MSNEATLVFETFPAIPFTCSNTAGIEKGTLCKMTDPMTCAISAAVNEVCAGITKTEKIANDGKTKISVYREGIFKVLASGAVLVGAAVASGADANFPNYVKQAAVTSSGAAVIGYALETAAAGESFLIYLDVGCGGMAIS